MTNWPGVTHAINFAQMSLLEPPGDYLKSLTKAARTRTSIDRKVENIHRVDMMPRLVFRAVLPLNLCPRMNELLGPRGSLIKGSKGKQVYKKLHEQNGFSRFLSVLAGRPCVRFVRFSVKRPDGDASWTKVPQDVLVNKPGAHMRLIEDDSDDHIDRHAWWEPGSANCQFVYLDVSTDETHSFK